MDSLKSKIRKLFEEIGEDCPYLLAKHLGVKISYRDDFGDVFGFYRATSPGTQRIFINSSINIEVQEKVCHNLICHHITHQGIPKSLTGIDMVINAPWSLFRSKTVKLLQF